MKRAYRTSASAERGRLVQRKPPHHGVYVRLASSPIHGVGVFAIRTIPKGTKLFPGDDEPVLWFTRPELGRMPRGIKQLYKDFCIKSRSGTYGCPKSFNNLTPAWYLNEPKKGELPNTRADENYDFYALKNIRPGEELTVDYSTYSEESQRSKSK